MIIVGDTHGKFERLQEIISEAADYPIYHVGDLGIGFPGHPYPRKFQSNFKFIRGNHDNPHTCRTHPSYLGDFGITDDVFYISGADSIDYMGRTPGLDWWDEEQLSHQQLLEAIELYKEHRPKVVISHDCPQETASKMFRYLNIHPSRTRYALQEMYNYHKPDRWIFGHYHESKSHDVFTCLGENDYSVL